MAQLFTDQRGVPHCGCFGMIFFRKWDSLIAISTYIFCSQWNTFRFGFPLQWGRPFYEAIGFDLPSIWWSVQNHKHQKCLTLQQLQINQAQESIVHCRIAACSSIIFSYVHKMYDVEVHACSNTADFARCPERQIDLLSRFWVSPDCKFGGFEFHSIRVSRIFMRHAAKLMWRLPSFTTKSGTLQNGQGTTKFFCWASRIPARLVYTSLSLLRSRQD